MKNEILNKAFINKSKRLMRYKIFIVLLFLVTIQIKAQSRITDYCISEIDNVFPKTMKTTTTWIDSTFSKLYISNFNFSESYNHDNNFYSFNLVSRNAKKIPLYKLNGITINPNFCIKGSRFLLTEKVIAELNDEKSAYLKTFDYDRFDFSSKSYYDLALKIARIEYQDVLAHTFNYFVELNKGKYKIEDKYEQFILDVNKKNKLKLNYVDKNKSIYGLRNYLVSNRINSIEDLVYNTYVLDKNEALTKRNIESFFGIVGVFEGDVFGTIDRMLTEKLKVSFEKKEVLEFPSTILKSVKDSVCLFSIERVEVSFDCKKRETEILLIGKANGLCQVKKGVRTYSSFGNKKTEAIKEYEIQPFDRIRIIINEKNIYLQVYTYDATEEYLITEGKF